MKNKHSFIVTCIVPISSKNLQLLKNVRDSASLTRRACTSAMREKNRQVAIFLLPTELLAMRRDNFNKYYLTLNLESIPF